MKHNTMNKTNRTSTTKIQKLYNILADGKNVTTAQLKRALRTEHVSSIVRALREKGATVWTNRVNRNGKIVTAYRFDASRS
jgi:hypothetical protein